MVGCKTEQGRSGINLFLMKEQLIKYGFEVLGNSLEYTKNGWSFEVWYEDHLIMYSPDSGLGEGIVLREISYEKIISLIEFISEYK